MEVFIWLLGHNLSKNGSQWRNSKAGLLANPHRITSDQRIHFTAKEIYGHHKGFSLPAGCSQLMLNYVSYTSLRNLFKECCCSQSARYFFINQHSRQSPRFIHIGKLDLGNSSIKIVFSDDSRLCQVDN